ncbi:MAG TPA: amidohydrolase family protein [Bacteroidales bacterium]|jgi:cytosine/adenosine deaminase-related metal-dependent hydrolase|nr:amidohydrolase family protein [Bacteroidales bacterium]HQH23813.1 amidohydrolase family protein [Bacteroidales bacterium]HQJ81638.1 amidohydrolase family protein [Bacteroidales bacterium]
MRRLSASLVFTNDGPPLRNGIVTTSDDGTILKVEKGGGSVPEADPDRGSSSPEPDTEFYNGIIIPGFVNCHCHLELSHLKGTIPAGKGLGPFLADLTASRKGDPETIRKAAAAADRDMYTEGTELCADICNNSSTFGIKRESRISYFNLIEVFASDPALAPKRMQEAENLAAESTAAGLPFSIVPHSVYSVSLPLFRLIREKSGGNLVNSIHFMESAGEEMYLSDRKGPLMDSFSEAGLIPPVLQTPENCVSAILDEVTTSRSLILVHNTVAVRETVRKINPRGKVYWCLCPNSNLHIEGKMPPVSMLSEEGCDIVIGTDSLASNENLSILAELKAIQQHYPSARLEDMIRWSTINGAKALGKESRYGSIAPGRKPGLLLIENADTVNMKLTPDTTVSRLI